MCGIFAYVGTSDTAANTVLDGLKLLEYRGYDSWGVAVKQGKTLAVEKHVGKIGDATVSLPKSSLGIGHTRWATHGGVTVENAHPHLDCNKEISVIHNGIIENYQELKDELLAKGHTFLSETDTEVVPHLIEEHLKTKGFATAVRDVFNVLRGLNAIVVAYAPSKQIVAAKTGSPLVVGKSDNGFYLASDASGIIKHTRELLFLKDKEMVILGDSVQLMSLPDGQTLVPHFETIDWTIEDVDKGTYDHFMLKEIHEQSTIIQNIALTYKDEITRLSSVIKKAKGTFLIASGTAYHACLAAVYLFSRIPKLHVNTAVASEFNYLEDFLTKDSLIIALSQSGETIDVIEPLHRAQEKGSRIAAIVNTVGSTIYRMADEKLLLGAGPEKAVASTKAYLAKIAILLLLAYAMVDNIDEAEQLLKKAAEEVKRLLSDDVLPHIKEIATLLSQSEHIYTIGRGVSYPTALEAALKIKEVSYVHTEGLAGGELKHGTIALITKGTPCLVFAPNDETFEAMVSNAAEIKARGGYLIGIGPKNTPLFDHWIEVKDVGDAQIIAQIIPAQLIAYYMALYKKCDPDKPRNLAKSVTVK